MCKVLRALSAALAFVLASQVISPATTCPVGANVQQGMRPRAAAPLSNLAFHRPLLSFSRQLTKHSGRVPRMSGARGFSASAAARNTLPLIQRVSRPELVAELIKEGADAARTDKVRACTYM